ncbi:MAG TPA: penicillin-binding protein 2 [Solirubrobacterales bacterium]|jgi:penicillin-binding protein 2|nr:penicillin-binding protein 2 [Solirubrobacterales bacterium]
MYERSNDRPGANSRLSLRIAVLGGVAVALFAVLFFRLWDLQVLSGADYLAEAKNNRTREYKVIAPRGDILDRDGGVLVENRTSLALQLNTSKLPQDPAEARQELTRLGNLVHMSLAKVRKTIREGEEVAAGAPVTLRKDVGYDLIYYLEENQRRFPGVTVQRVFVRAYPDASRAAHVVGSVGEVSEEELEESRYEGLEPGDEVGKGGAEYTYDHYLRGQPGLTKIQVNALGQPTPGGQLVSDPPTPGDNLKLTIDPEVQAAGESALASRGLPGAFISMNIDNGQILGLGSSPTFDPTVLAREKTQAEVNALYRDPIRAPLTDRATEGLYPTGSIFKIITALSALDSGVITPSSTIVDNGELVVGGQSFHNAGEASYGALTLVPALQVSSDVFFYDLGLKMWDTGELQKWAHEMGIGRPTGLDLPGSVEGLLPTRKWRDDLYKAGETERPWSAGDNIQLATGQGDLQTNPLQMAIAYAALGNGGKIVTPHVGLEVEDAAGRVLKEFDPPIRRQFHIDPTFRSTILEGLHDAAQVAPGTAAGVFGGFPVPVAGKTGTAERPGHADQSWFAVLAPYPDPRIVTIVTIEEGGFGAESAAPAALQILEAYFKKQATEVSAAGGAE